MMPGTNSWPWILGVGIPQDGSSGIASLDVATLAGAVVVGARQFAGACRRCTAFAWAVLFAGVVAEARALCAVSRWFGKET